MTQTFRQPNMGHGMKCPQKRGVRYKTIGTLRAITPPAECYHNVTGALKRRRDDVEGAKVY